MASPEYKPNAVVLSALLFIGLALAGSMFYVLVFPTKAKPILCTNASTTCVNIPNGVSSDSSLNFQQSNVTITVSGYVEWKNKDNSPHTVTSLASTTSVPTGATKFDSGELDLGDTFYVQLTIPGRYSYHCIFHPNWMKGTIIVTSS